MSETRFHYAIYLRTTPEELWRALTEPALLGRWFEGTGPESDWRVGSPVRWAMSPGADFRDAGQVVLTSEPGRRLAYTWHNYEPELAEMFGWSPERLVELRREPVSEVRFELEPVGESVVALKLTHDGFVPDSAMLKGVRDGWPMLLSNLKTLLETGETLPFPAE